MKACAFLALLLLPLACAARECAPASWLRLDGARPAPVSPAPLLDELARRDVVLLGEQHDDADHHRWQLHTLAALQARRPRMVIGVEMLPRRLQPLLDRWVAGELTPEAFLAEARWDEVWGVPAELYLPIFEFARLHRIPIAALNVERTLTQAVAQKGWDAVPQSEREGVGRPAAPAPAYVEDLSRVHREHREPGPLDYFVQAQQTWDRAMAEALARHAGGALAVGIIGSGHLRNGHGVPHQLRDLGITRLGTLLPVSASQCGELAAGLADAAFVVPEGAPRKPAPPRLGVQLEQQGGAVRLAEVTPGSLADRSGLRKGDVVLSVAGTRLAASQGLVDAVRRQPNGTWLPLQVRRGDELLDIVVKFPAEPDLSLDVQLHPGTRELSAVAELARPAGPFRFELHESLGVRAPPATSRPARGGMREWTVQQRAPGKLRIEYGGRLPALERVDHRGVLRALPPMASPDGSYLGAGSGWYPAPAATFTYRVRLEVRGGQKGLVAGRLGSEEESAAAYRAVFDYAAPAEGIDLMAGPYQVREKLQGAVRLRTYFFGDLTPLADAYLEDSARYVEQFSRAIGPYPFSEFSVVASPLPSGFGMPTLTYIGADVLKLPFIRATSLGHEVLHNWWGNGVLVDPARGNWSEGLTTFMADYAFRERASPQSARDMRLGWLRDLASVPEQSQQPLTSFRSRAHGADAVSGYAKAAMVFLMLRDAIGDAAFERGVRQFWQAQRFKRASWDELRLAFEQAAGRPLGAFFEQWLGRPGAPRVRILAARATGKELLLTLEQSAPAYALRLPVEALFDSGAQTRWLELDQPRQTVALPFDRMPRAVRLDPELRVWRRLERAELPPILRQWIVARSPGLVVASSGLQDAARKLAARFFESPFEVLQGLGSGENPVLLVGLHADVDAALARLGLPPRPAAVAGKGSAQVWTVPDSRVPVAVISAGDAAAVEALQRPLPHYGAQSYLAFDGARVIERGAWPPTVPAVQVSGG